MILRYSVGLAKRPAPPEQKMSLFSDSVAVSGRRQMWSYGRILSSARRVCMNASREIMEVVGKKVLSVTPRGSNILALKYSSRFCFVIRSIIMPVQSTLVLKVVNLQEIEQIEEISGTIGEGVERSHASYSLKGELTPYCQLVPGS